MIHHEEHEEHKGKINMCGPQRATGFLDHSPRRH
jgi:hypothetical protein